MSTERAERDQWTRLGLGGATLVIRYQTRGAAATAVQYLMTHGHGHHFAVVGEGQTLVLSELAAECLKLRGGAGTARAGSGGKMTQ